MGNLYAESGFKCDNLQGSYESILGHTDESYTNAVDNGTYSKNSFVNDSAGYGLAQWTYYTRKQNLYEMYKSGSYSSIGSVQLACDFLMYELENDYPDVLTVLKTAGTIRIASNKVLHDFEAPKNHVGNTAKEIKRANYGVAIWNELIDTGTYKPRTDSGGIQGSFYWYSQNPFYLSGWGLPNCTCYAWGRFWEISDPNGDGSNKPTLPTGDAGTWFGKVTGYETGSEPRLGAVICWDHPSTGGHVAIVEEIYDNGNIRCSNSAYGGSYFYMQTYYKADGYNFGRYTFQGFIYNPYAIGYSPLPDYKPPKKKNGFKFVLFT
jgi:surface antigen